MENGRVYETKCKTYNLGKVLGISSSFILGFVLCLCIFLYKGNGIPNAEILIENDIIKEINHYTPKTHGPFKPLRLVKIWEWEGGEKIDKHKLSETIYAVMKRLGIEENKDLHDLVMETCAVETDFGYIVKQVNGPALSMYQILPSTFRYLLDKIKDNDKELHKKVMYFYDLRKNNHYNFVYNVPFTTAVCMLYYLDVTPDIDKKIKTREERANLWKQKYNTPLGKGTVNIYLKRTRKHIT